MSQLIQYLKQTDNTEPQVEGYDNLNESDEEEEDADDLEADQPQTEAHSAQVGQEEAEGADDPGEHEPCLLYTSPSPRDQA